MTAQHPGAVLAPPVPPEVAAATLADLLRGGRFAVLTGAGLSTDSGIPDYRSPGAPVRSPMTATEFRSGPVARQRYWARSYLGFGRMARALPNAGHRALAALEHAGRTTTTITQNVDGLHGEAGSRRVVDLHGRIDEVRCLDCGQVTARDELQQRMAALNPDFAAHQDLSVNPDGDVDFEDTDGFRVPVCRRCTGVLKPRVVFFGDSVPKDTVEQCFSAVETSDALLVAGSSLTVMSGLRFVRRAAALGRPVAILNRGTTRGDELATVRLDAGCSETLAGLARSLDHRPDRAADSR
ncbi:NAD-dependent protein deacetylase [Nakamurella alba]|uniref:NAD-dependent protein deacetylase n=1 Tax=Nakamurella alba TaxID=2665158 RepID=UPI002AC35B60|nr:NAD-dependent protein deacetylase [Nakamurella alba]